MRTPTLAVLLLLLATLGGCSATRDDDDGGSARAVDPAVTNEAYLKIEERGRKLAEAEAEAAPAPEPKPGRRVGRFPAESSVPRRFGLSKPAGDDAVRQIVVAAGDVFRKGGPRTQTLNDVRRLFAIVGAQYGEVSDPPVCARIQEQLNRYLRPAGLAPIKRCAEFLPL